MVRKQVRINGAPKRALDLIGRLRVVLFLPEDISLVAGSPAERRRYLDIALCQIDPAYCRALAEYKKDWRSAMLCSNACAMRAGISGNWPSGMASWPGTGAPCCIAGRWQSASLDRLAAGRHHDLTQGAERLRLAYLPSPNPLRLLAARLEDAETAAAYAEMPHEQIAERLAAGLLRSPWPRCRQRHVAAWPASR